MFNNVFDAALASAVMSPARKWAQGSPSNRVPVTPPPKPMRVHPFTFAPQFIVPWETYDGYTGTELLDICRIVSGMGPEAGNTKATRASLGERLRVPPDSLKEPYETALKVFREWSKGREFPGYVITYMKKSYD